MSLAGLSAPLPLGLEPPFLGLRPRLLARGAQQVLRVQLVRVLEQLVLASARERVLAPLAQVLQSVLVLVWLELAQALLRVQLVQVLEQLVLASAREQVLGLALQLG